MAGQFFANANVAIGGDTFTLEMMYPEGLGNGQIVNSSCGVHLTYIYRHILTSVMSNPLVSVSINGVASHNWSLVDFELLSGCGAFMLSTPAQRCSICPSGFYQLRSQQNILMGCAMCHSSCLTCNENRCITCKPNMRLQPNSGICAFENRYVRVANYTVQEGTDLSSNDAEYFQNLVASDPVTNAITVGIRLLSPAPYLLRMTLVFSRTLPLTLSEPITIFNGENQLLTVPTSDLRAQMGFYDSRLSNGTQKYYIKSIQIDRLSAENLNRNLLIRITSPSILQMFYIGDIQLMQYQCVDGCLQCDVRTNACLECQGFFINNGTCQSCPNGFYRTVQNGEQKCVKCHSTCMQCSGPGQANCTQCFPNFELQTPNFNRRCIDCLFAQNGTCPSDCPSSNSILSNPICRQCTQGPSNEAYSSQLCRQCWNTFSLSSARCAPTLSSGFVLYGSDLTGSVDNRDWTGSEPLSLFNCSRDYPNLYGIRNSTGSGRITWRQNSLPTHTGLFLVMDILKVDIEPSVSPNGTQVYPNISVTINNVSYPLEFMNRKNGSILIPGSNICSNQSKEMLQTFTFLAQNHTSSSFEFVVTSQEGNIFLRQVYLYLANCETCWQNQLSYEVKYVPRNPYQKELSSGLDVWIIFNRAVQVEQQSRARLREAFTFEIDKLPDRNITAVEFVDDLDLNNRLKYYLPLDESFVNASLIVNVNPEIGIFGQRGARRLLIDFPLELVESDQIIKRYNVLDDDDQVSTTQLYWFFNFFQWFALITMIVCILLGIGVVFEEFSIVLQLLFLHVYISMPLLPATFRAPMWGLQRMQNLNYFANPSIESIENQWFGDRIHPSPYIFTIYNKDILFLRSFYPTIIINLVYLGWFLILFIMYKLIAKFQTSNSTFIGFFRNIPARPLNYMDQIWRYQFITTCWSAFMQFHNLHDDSSWWRFNLAMCFICFIFSVIWPFFIVGYTYRLNSIKYSTEFMYKYQDIFFKKIQSISQGKIKYYNYILIRFARYFIIALFICVFTQHQIIGPVILICANLIEIIYVASLNIFYNSVAGALLKILENVIFIGIQICFLIVYAISDNSSHGVYLNLGYALVVLYVILIIVAFLRVGYYLYHKAKTMKYIMKFGKDHGEIVQVGPTPLPNTDRFEA